MVEIEAMADALELHVTMPDAERATALARALVDEGLAACVNIVPGVRSIYQWDGRLQEDDEVLCLIKTRPAVFDRAARPDPRAAPLRGPRDPGVRRRRRQPRLPRVATRVGRLHGKGVGMTAPERSTAGNPSAGRAQTS